MTATETTTYQGKISNIEVYPSGDMVDQAYAAGATSILLLDPTDFSELGGQVAIAGVVYSYTTVDFDSGIMTLTSPLVAAIEDGTNVDIYPPTEEKRAIIQMQDGQDGVVAIVPHTLADRLDVGIRQEDQQETVTLWVVREQWTIRDIVGLAPTVIASYIDPGTVTPPSAPSLPVPSTPSLYSKLGTVTYTWDGKDNTGKVMPSQFDHINVYMGTGPGTSTALLKEARRNLVTNPAPSSVTGWLAGAGGSTVTYVSTGGPTGGGLIHTVCDGLTAAQGVFFQVTVTGMPSGTTFAASIAMRQPSGAVSIPVYIRLNYTDAGLSQGPIVPVTPGASWARYSAGVARGTPGATLSSVQVFVRLLGTTAMTFDVAQLILEAVPPGGVGGDYFDGSNADTLTTDYSWTGTAGSSASIASTIIQGALQETRRNLCTNPSFESSIASWATTPTYWNNAGGVLTQDSSWADVGGFSGKVVCDGTANQQGAATTFIGVANTTYTVSATIKNTSGRPVFIRVRDTTNLINSANSAQVNAGETTRVSTTITTGATANPGVLVAVTTDTTAGASTFNFDSVLIEAGTTLGDFFDGDTADNPDVWYDWVGTAMLSASTAQVVVKADANLSNYLDHLYAAGSGIVTKQPGGVTRYFKYRAVDKAGNIGPESVEASIVVQRIVGPDIQANSVTTNELQVGSVTADKIELGTVRSNLMADPSLEEDYPLEVWDPFNNLPRNPRRWRLDTNTPASVTLQKTTAIGPATRTNLALNPIGPTGTVLGWWVGGRGTLALNVDAIRLTITDALVAVLGQRINNPTTQATSGLPVTPGVAYTASADIRTNASADTIVGLQWMDSSSTIIGSIVFGTAVVANATTYVRISATGVAPANASYLIPQFGLNNGARAINQWIDFRNVLIETSTIMRPFFDGNVADTATKDYSWSGTAMNSTSTELTAPIKRSRSGGRALQLTSTVTNEIGGFISPACKVDPGKTYRLSFFAASLNLTSAMSVTLLTGNTDEYSPWYFNDIPMTGDDPTWTSPPLVTEPVDPESLQGYSYTFTVPMTGVTYVCLRFQNYGAAPGSTLIADDFAIVELGGSGATELTAAGLRLFGPDGLEIGAFVNNRPNYFSISSQGDTVASINSGGVGSFAGASVLGVDTDGDGTPDRGFQVYGREFIDWLSDLPQGLIRWGNRSASQGYFATGSYQKFLEIQVPLPTGIGRLFKVTATGLNVSQQTAGGYVETRLTYGYNGADAFTSQYRWQRTACPAASTQYGAPNLEVVFGMPDGHTNTEIRWGLSAQANGSGGALNIGTSNLLQLTMEDLGPIQGEIGIDYSLVTPPPTKKTYVTTWTANNSESYRGDGSARTDTTDLVQGYNSYNGDGHAHMLFTAANSTGGETNVSIATALSGATLTKAEVYLYANHWWYNSGGTALIRASTLTSLSGSTPSGTIVSSPSWPLPGGRWVTITSIFTASCRSVFVGKSGGSNLLYYGRFNYQGNSSGKPQLRLTYTK